MGSFLLVLRIENGIDQLEVRRPQTDLLHALPHERLLDVLALVDVSTDEVPMIWVPLAVRRAPYQ
jgi:hypothetical protein